MKALVIFVFLLQIHPIYIFRNFLDVDILSKNVLIQSESIGAGLVIPNFDSTNQIQRFLKHQLTQGKPKLFNYFPYEY